MALRARLRVTHEILVAHLLVELWRGSGRVSRKLPIPILSSFGEILPLAIILCQIGPNPLRGIESQRARPYSAGRRPSSKLPYL